MQALIFGLVAALAWGFHDLCVRFVSQRISILGAMLTVLATGAILVGSIAALWGDWTALTLPALALSGLSGVIYAGCNYALYRAFAIGPVKLVAPLIGAFPLLSLGMAMLQGQPVGFGHWIAVVVVIGGVGAVALLSADEDGGAFDTSTILWAIAAAVGFAMTFAVGQTATRTGADLPVLILTRMAAVLTVIAVVIISRASIRPPLRTLPLLCIMGALDALALGLVLYSGTLPRAEFAAVSSSLFGLITVVLAWAILRETMTRGQWASVAITFAGIAYLGL